LPLTQTQLTAAVVERAGLPKADAKRALAALEVVLEQIGEGERVRIGGLVSARAACEAPTKKRWGRNPATGEEITIAAKPGAWTCAFGRW
jgi:nucleoid DNA-binding protein